MQVQEISSEYWERYKDEDPEHEDVKLLRYPINVDDDGTVSALEEPFNCFPDTMLVTCKIVCVGVWVCVGVNDFRSIVSLRSTVR